MKKAIAYASIAAVLGIVIMLAPFLTLPAVVPSSQTSGADAYGRAAPIPQNLAPANTQAEATKSEASAGIASNYSVDAVTIAIMLFFSLAVAFSAYFYARRSHFLKGQRLPV